MIETAAFISVLAANILGWLILLFVSVFVFKNILRKGEKTGWLKRQFLKLRKKHIPMGKSMITLACLHGICACAVLPHFSSLEGSDFTAGISGMILLVLLGFSYRMRRSLGSKWIFVHRGLALAFVVAISWHLTTEAPIIELVTHARE